MEIALLVAVALLGVALFGQHITLKELRQDLAELTARMDALTGGAK